MRYLTSLTLVFLFLNVHAQFSPSACEAIFKSADSLFQKGNYSLAIRKISAYKICANTTQNQKADNLLLNIYETVNRQRDNAIKAQREAERQTGIAQEATAAAVSAQEAEKLAKEAAVAQRKVAEERLKIMTSRKLLTDAIAAQQESPPQWHLSLLLSEKALKLAPSAESEAVVRGALARLPVFLQEQNFGEYIGTAKLSSSGKYFAISSGDDYASGGKTQIWSMADLQVIYTINEPGPFQFANDSDLLITSSRNNNALIVDCETRTIIGRLPHELSNVEILAVSPDDNYLITKNYETGELGGIEAADYLSVWDIDEQKVINKIQPHNTVGKDYGRVFFFNYGGKELIGSNWYSGKTEIWELKKRKKISIPELDNEFLSRNGKYLITRQPDQVGFSLSTLEGLRTIIDISEEVKGYEFSDNGKYLLLFGERKLQMWDLVDERMRWEKNEGTSSWRFGNTQFSSDGRYFSFDNSNEVRSMYTGEIIATNYWSESNDSIQTQIDNRIVYTVGKNLRFSDPASTLLFSQSGDTLITATRGGSLQFWRIKPSSEKSQSDIPMDRILVATSSERGASCYVGTYYGVFKYDAQTAVIDTLVKRKRSVFAVAVAEDESKLAFGVQYETLDEEPYGVFIMDLESSEIIRVGLNASIYSLSFNEGGDKLLIGTGVSQFRPCDCGLWLYDFPSDSMVKIDSSAANISAYNASFYQSDSLVFFTTGFDTKIIKAESGEVVFEAGYGDEIGFSTTFNSVLRTKADLLYIYSIDTETQKLQLQNTQQFKGEIASIKLAKHNPYVLITFNAGGKGKVILWNYLAKTEINHFEVDGEVVSADFSLSDSNIIVCFDNKISSYSLSYRDLLESCEERKIRSLSTVELESSIGDGYQEILGNE